MFECLVSSSVCNEIILLNYYFWNLYNLSLFKMASNVNDNEMIGRLLDGRYQVLDTIGYGAFADVYLVKYNNTEYVLFYFLNWMFIF